MTRFQDLSIRHKLRAVILVISGLALLGACSAFLVHQWYSSKEDLAARMRVLAEIVGEQSTAAVEFAQEPQAAAILRTLKAERQVVAAALYARDGRLFASYGRDAGSAARVPARAGPDGHRFADGGFQVLQPLVSERERIGTFYLHSDMSAARSRLGVNLAVVALILLAAAAAVLYLSARLGGLITGPLLGLAEVAQAVSTRRDYTLRAERRGADELGRLVDGFNDMLSQIQQRDSALAQARDELEKRVQERTRELEEEVAERKSAESRLRENDLRLTEAQEIARLGSWEWTLATQKVAWSDEVYRICGLLPHKFGGGYEDFLALAHPDDRAALREALVAACAAREPLALDYRIIHPDGAVRFLHAQAKPVLDDAGRVVRLLGTLQDVSERRRAEQAIQDLNRELQARMTDLAMVNKELEGFSYSVSHDLRAPLRAIDGFSRMLIEDCGPKLDAEGRRYLDVVVENARKMGQLIDDLLAFSRMGRKSLQAAALDMGAMARQVVEELRAQHPERALEVSIGELPPGRGDPAMFRQVFVNLLSNAVKYSRGRNPGRIEIGARRDPASTVYFVRDNGVGFPMEYAHKLFEVFQRLHSAEEFEGTGVGLSLVHRIVTRHGGRVWAESALGEGATFYFSLPAASTT